MHQEFKAHVDLENYVILGNDAILKCDIPSFVADLVLVDAWVDSAGNTIRMVDDSVSGNSLESKD